MSVLYNQTNIYSKNYVKSILINNEELSSTERGGLKKLSGIYFYLPLHSKNKFFLNKLTKEHEPYHPFDVIKNNPQKNVAFL